MDVQILEEAKTETTRYFNLQCGKQAIILVFYPESGRIRVLVCNASHRAWGGIGKLSNSIEEALTKYKSAEVKAALEYVQGAIK